MTSAILLSLFFALALLVTRQTQVQAFAVHPILGLKSMETSLVLHAKKKKKSKKKTSVTLTPPRQQAATATLERPEEVQQEEATTEPIPIVSADEVVKEPTKTEKADSKKSTKTVESASTEKATSSDSAPESQPDEAALQEKYAAIESLEDRAYQILVDLNMVGQN